MGVLFIIILISSIFAIAVFIWFRLARYPFTMPLFSAALLAGAASIFPALFFQYIFPAGSGIFQLSDKWGLFAEIFIRIALTEELSRFLILFILFTVIVRIFKKPIDKMPNAAGLVAGIGFAILENSVYGASNFDVTFLRAFTAAPLHGACGSRVGASVVFMRESPVHGILRFLSAVAIHGAYNFMLNIPSRFAGIAAAFIVFSALGSSIQVIRSEMKVEANPYS